MVSDIEMLRLMGALDPAPVFMGGWAEDALLAGTMTRERFFPDRSDAELEPDVRPLS